MFIYKTDEREDQIQEPRIKWQKLKCMKMIAFKDKVVKDADWEDKIDIMQYGRK